jgi:prevent-host-death family protein
MEIVSISVTDASRNFAECINRVRYQGASYLLHKGGAPVARILSVEQKPRRGNEQAAALEQALRDAHLGESEATSWLHDLEQARSSLRLR